jgi:hypothetical protein
MDRPNRVKLRGYEFEQVVPWAEIIGEMQTGDQAQHWQKHPSESIITTVDELLSVGDELSISIAIGRDLTEDE